MDTADIIGMTVTASMPGAAAFIACLLARFARKRLGKPQTATAQLFIWLSAVPFTATYVAATGAPPMAWIPLALLGVGATLTLTILVLMNGTSGQYAGDMALRNIEEYDNFKKWCSVPFVTSICLMTVGLMFSIPSAHLYTYVVCMLTGGFVGSLLLNKFCGKIVEETHPESDARMSWNEFLWAFKPPVPRIVTIMKTNVILWATDHGTGGSKKNSNQ